MEVFLAQNLYLKNPHSISSLNSHFLLNRPKLVTFSHSFSQETQIQKSIICARNKKRQYGSAKSTRFMIESAYQIASKLKILPEPLDYLIKEFGVGGGNGGGGFGTFWKGHGWGGFDGWGRRRRKKIKLEFLGILVILGLGFWVILGKEFDSDVFLGALGLILFGLSVDGWRNGMKDWALGFCCCAVLVSLVFGREVLQRWTKSFGPMKLSRRRKGRVF